MRARLWWSRDCAPNGDYPNGAIVPLGLGPELFAGSRRTGFRLERLDDHLGLLTWWAARLPDGSCVTGGPFSAQDFTLAKQRAEAAYDQLLRVRRARRKKRPLTP